MIPHGSEYTSNNPDDWRAVEVELESCLPNNPRHAEFINYLKKAAVYYQMRLSTENPERRKELKTIVASTAKVYSEVFDTATKLKLLLEDPAMENTAPWLDAEWNKKLSVLIEVIEKSPFRKPQRAKRQRSSRYSTHALCNTFLMLVDFLYSSDELTGDALSAVAETFLVAAGYKPNDRRGDGKTPSDIRKLLKRAKTALSESTPTTHHLVKPFFMFAKIQDRT